MIPHRLLEKIFFSRDALTTKGMTVNVFLSSFCVGTFACLMVLAGSSSAKEELCENARNDTKGIIQVCYRTGDPITPSLRRQYWRFINNSDQTVTFRYFIYGAHNGSSLRLASRMLTLLPHASQTSDDASSDQFIGSNGAIWAEVYPSSLAAGEGEKASSASSKKNWCTSDAFVMPGTCTCIPHTTPGFDPKTGQAICRRKAPLNKKEASSATPADNAPMVCDPAITSCMRMPQPSGTPVVVQQGKSVQTSVPVRTGYGSRVVRMFR
jgi:hypothetical protein